MTVALATTAESASRPHNIIRDVQKERKNKPSKFDILIVNENIHFKFDYFAGNEVGGSFFILKERLYFKRGMQ